MSFMFLSKIQIKDQVCLFLNLHLYQTSNPDSLGVNFIFRWKFGFKIVEWNGSGSAEGKTWATTSRPTPESSSPKIGAKVNFSSSKFQKMYRINYLKHELFGTVDFFLQKSMKASFRFRIRRLFHLFHQSYGRNETFFQRW